MMVAMLASYLLVADPPCTHEQAMAKGEELSRAMQDQMARDPARTRAMMDELAVIGRDQQAPANGGFPDWDHVCATYDLMLQRTR